VKQASIGQASFIVLIDHDRIIDSVENGVSMDSAHLDGMLMSNEKQDVVEYRQNVFLLVIQDLESKTRKQGRDGPGEEDEPTDKPHTVFFVP
jgi:hypothetical protein